MMEAPTLPASQALLNVRGSRKRGVVEPQTGANTGGQNCEKHGAHPAATGQPVRGSMVVVSGHSMGHTGGGGTVQLTQQP